MKKFKCSEIFRELSMRILKTAFLILFTPSLVSPPTKTMEFVRKPKFIRSCQWLILLSFFLLGCTSERGTGEKQHKEVDNFLASFINEREAAEIQLSKTHANLQKSPNSTHREQFAKAQAAYEEVYINAATTIIESELLAQQADISLQEREQLLFIAERGAGRTPAKIRESFLFPQQLFALRDTFNYTLYRKPLSLSEADSLLKIAANLRFREQLWKSAQLPADTLYKYWELTRNAINEGITADYGGDAFTYHATKLGYTSSEVNQQCAAIVVALKPIYNLIHQLYAQQLAKKYGRRVQEQLPIHWFPDKTGITWSSSSVTKELTAIISDMNVQKQQQLTLRYLKNIGLTNQNVKPLKTERNGFPERVSVSHLYAQPFFLLNYGKRNEALAQSFGHTAANTLVQAAQNVDLPPALRGELHPQMVQRMYQLFSRIPFNDRFWLEEQEMNDSEISDYRINQLHQAYHDIVYCIYVASVVTPLQQLFYTQTYAPELIAERYWKAMEQQMKIIYPSFKEDKTEISGLPADVLLQPLAHYENMLSILWSYNWVVNYSENSPPQDLYLSKSNKYGVTLYNTAYQGVRYPFPKLMADLGVSEVSPNAMASYYQSLKEALTDSLENPVKTYVNDAKYW